MARYTVTFLEKKGWKNYIYTMYIYTSKEAKKWRFGCVRDVRDMLYGVDMV